jgi:hypothetical protein
MHIWTNKYYVQNNSLKLQNSFVELPKGTRVNVWNEHLSRLSPSGFVRLGRTEGLLDAKYQLPQRTDRSQEPNPRLNVLFVRLKLRFVRFSAVSARGRHTRVIVSPETF